MTTEEPVVVLCPREAEILRQGGPGADALRELIKAAERFVKDKQAKGEL